MEYAELVKAMKEILYSSKFVKTRSGYLIKPVIKEKINKEAKQAVKNVKSEFKNATISASTLRNSVAEILPFISGAGMQGRMVSRIYEILRTDKINEREFRNAHHGNTGLLKGFDFNSLGRMNSIFFAFYNTEINRTTGEVKLFIPPIESLLGVPRPKGATHFKIISIATELNFLDHTSKTSYLETEEISYTERYSPYVSHIHQLPPNSIYPLVLLLNIRFYQFVNGEYYTFLNKKINFLSVIAVDKVE